MGVTVSQNYCSANFNLGLTLPIPDGMSVDDAREMMMDKMAPVFDKGNEADVGITNLRAFIQKAKGK